MKLAELTALYSPLDLEYSQVMSGPYEDLSYRIGHLVNKAKDCEVVAGLKDGRISGFWRPMVAVGEKKALQAQIERLWSISQDIYFMDFLIDGELSPVSRFLLKKGYTARPYYTQIIDLTKTEDELHADLRKSYKSLINNDLVMCYIPSEDYLPEYRLMYEEAGGRRQEGWDIQQDMLLQSQAFIVMRRGNDAGGLFYYNRYCCYYASGKSLDGVNSHAVIWNAVIEAMELGCKTFELGEQVFSGDPKLVNISAFKKGFGGKTVTRLILEKECPEK